MFAPWLLFSSAAGTRQRWTKSLESCGTSLGLPSRSELTKPIANCSTRTDGCGWRMPAPGQQRLLWASTGTKDPAASDVLYIKALAAPFTVNTIPDKTLLAFADHGSEGELMEADGGDAEETIAKFAKAGIDCDRLATDLQREAAGSFVNDWNEMLASIALKISGFKAAG